MSHPYSGESSGSLRHLEQENARENDTNLSQGIISVFTKNRIFFDVKEFQRKLFQNQGSTNPNTVGKTGLKERKTMYGLKYTKIVYCKYHKSHLDFVLNKKAFIRRNTELTGFSHWVTTF